MKKQIIIAKKPCSFNGQKFFIGNPIPSEYVLDPNAQKSMGVIEVVEVESDNGNDGAAPTEGGSLLPPSSTSDDEDQDNTEDGQSEGSENTEGQEATKYSKSTLLRMNRETLSTLATERGIVVNAEMTKEDIADLILEKQGE